MFSKPFSKSDPRLKVALETHEPLIHFALVCGAKSCPPIKTYSADVSTKLEFYEVKVFCMAYLYDAFFTGRKLLVIFLTKLGQLKIYRPFLFPVVSAFVSIFSSHYYIKNIKIKNPNYEKNHHFLGEIKR